MIKKVTCLFSNKKTIKIFFLFLIILTLILPIIQADTPAVTTQETTNRVIQEHIRTRTEIKAYLDKKQADLETFVMNKGQKFIDENFQAFDNRMQKLATKMLIKVLITLVGGVLLAQLLFYLIKRRIERKVLPQATTLKPDTLTPTKSGLFTDEYKRKIEGKKEEEQEELPTFPELEVPKPPPSIPQEKGFVDLWAERKKQQAIEKENKKREKQRKKLLEQVEKRKKQAEKEQGKLRKKLSKPEEKEKKLIEEIEKLDKLKEKIDKPIT